MKKPKRAGARTSTMSESELLAQWAAEEFVAAGRAGKAQDRQAHRQRALFFREVLGGLETSELSSSPAAGSDLADLLNLAFRPDRGRSQPTAVPLDRDAGTPPASDHPKAGNGRGASCTDYLNRMDGLQPDSRPPSRLPSEL
jgi:hypothetical protein